MKKPVPLRIPDHLLDLADLRARKERVDKATALRQILYEGAEGYALRLLSRRELSLSRGAELLGLSAGEVLDLAVTRGLEIGGHAGPASGAATPGGRCGPAADRHPHRREPPGVAHLGLPAAAAARAAGVTPAVVRRGVLRGPGLLAARRLAADRLVAGLKRKVS